MRSRLGAVAAGVLAAAAGAAGQESGLPGLRLAEPESAGRDGALVLPGAPVPEVSVEKTLDEAFGLIEEQRNDEALAIIESVMLRAPEDLRARVARAILHTRMHEYAEAVALLEQLMEEYPDNVPVLNNAAWVYAIADDPAVRDGHRAVTLARRALVSAPGSYHIWSTMAEGYYVTGQFRKALEAAQEALQMAVRQQASDDNLREYRTQVRKSEQAVRAFSLLE